MLSFKFECLTTWIRMLISLIALENAKRPPNDLIRGITIEHFSSVWDCLGWYDLCWSAQFFSQMELICLALSDGFKSNKSSETSKTKVLQLPVAGVWHGSVKTAKFTTVWIPDPTKICKRASGQKTFGTSRYGIQISKCPKFEIFWNQNMQQHDY